MFGQCGNNAHGKERRLILTKTLNTEDKKVSTLKTLIETTLDANKAQDIETIDLRDQSVIADFMIIATGQSSRQVVALSQKIEEAVSKQGQGILRIEGVQKGDWVVVDTGDIIIHLFRPEVREFYALEKMWGGAPHMLLTQKPEGATRHA